MKESGKTPGEMLNETVRCWPQFASFVSTLCGSNGNDQKSSSDDLKQTEQNQPSSIAPTSMPSCEVWEDQALDHWIQY